MNVVPGVQSMRLVMVVAEWSLNELWDESVDVVISAEVTWRSEFFIFYFLFFPNTDRRMKGRWVPPICHFLLLCLVIIIIFV